MRAFDTSHVPVREGLLRLEAPGLALCFLAGANSVFYGDVLLTAPNAGTDADAEMFAALGALEDA